MNTENNMLTMHNLDNEVDNRVQDSLRPYSQNPAFLHNMPKEKPMPEDIGTAVILWIVALICNSLSNIFSFPGRDQMLQIAQDMNVQYSQYGSNTIAYASMITGVIIGLLVIIVVTAAAIWRYARASKIAMTILSIGTVLTVLNAINAFFTPMSPLAAITVIIAAVADIGAFLMTQTRESKKFFGIVVDPQKK